MQCQYKKPDNTQCQANAMHTSSFCFSHNPETREAKKIAVRKGGLAPKKLTEELTPIKIQYMQDILALLEDTINRIRTKPMTHQKANCIGYLANIFIKTIETAILEERLNKIERAILEKKQFAIPKTDV